VSLPKDPPVSLKGIQDNFYKSGAVGSVDRYVIDFAQRDGVTWDLLDYAGQAYGLQYDIYDNGYGGGTADRAVQLDESDRRADGAVSDVGVVSLWGSYAIVGEDDQGKYAEIQAYQARLQSPGSIGLNGIWYADEAGPNVRYRMRATVETSDDFSTYGEAGVFVFGYKYGYLDGSRKTYSLWGNGERPGPSQTLTVDETFTVGEDCRHIVVNMNSWLPGRWNEYHRAGFKVRNLIIERDDS
jgi:hypothetical protein